MPPRARSGSRCSRRTSTSRSSRTSSGGSASAPSAPRSWRASPPASRSSRSSTTSSSSSSRRGDRTFRLQGNPAVISLVGLQGSGKTTTAAKLAQHIVKLGRRPLLVAADPYRPAAADQLETLGQGARHPRLPGARRHVDASTSREGSLEEARRLDARHGHPRHRRPPEPRRGADGRDRDRRQGGPPGRDAPRRRRHDRPGGGRRRPGVRRGGAGDRPDPHQDRWRRARRRGALDRHGHRARASSSWAPARRPTPWRSSIPTGSPAGSWAWATS